MGLVAATEIEPFGPIDPEPFFLQVISSGSDQSMRLFSDHSLSFTTFSPKIPLCTLQRTSYKSLQHVCKLLRLSIGAETNE